MRLYRNSMTQVGSVLAHEKWVQRKWKRSQDGVRFQGRFFDGKSFVSNYEKVKSQQDKQPIPLVGIEEKRTKQEIARSAFRRRKQSSRTLSPRAKRKLLCQKGDQQATDQLLKIHSHTVQK